MYYSQHKIKIAPSATPSPLLHCERRDLFQVSQGRCGLGLHTSFLRGLFFFLWFLYPHHPVCFFFQILLQFSGFLVSHFIFPVKGEQSSMVSVHVMCLALTHWSPFLWNLLSVFMVFYFFVSFCAMELFWSEHLLVKSSSLQLENCKF